MDPQVFNEITISDLHHKASEYAQEGWRFVNLCATTVEGGVELLYSFSKLEAFENLRLVAGPDESVPSVSDLYFNAFVFENEAHDLFGVSITDIAIDFGGNFYAVSVPTPMNPQSSAATSAFRIVSRDGVAPTSADDVSSESERG